jgi:N-methylhydantoinase A
VGYRIGIDVGGTFTDVVGVDQAGKVVFAKAASSPADPSMGVIAGLKRLAAELTCDLAALLHRTERIVHGTTVATNALLERKGARVGLLTTEGHRDVIEMREGLKQERYNLRMPPPVQIVPRRRRIGVRERVRADGRVAVPLDTPSLQRALARLQHEGVEAVAVCYLHSYRNPRHEKLTRRAVLQTLPDAYVSLSSEVLPQIKEYERFSTTVVNASVGPLLSGYLERLCTRLREAGYAGSVLIMQSHGGVASVREAARLAAGAVLSGPAGGVAGSVHCGRLLGIPQTIAFDMGGTSTDISLIAEGAPQQVARTRAIAEHPVSLPSLDIVSLGAGGGSIAWVDPGGVLRVGPQSAGADPGPACYGQGGTEATVTDANLVLGYLDAKNFLGGQKPLDAAAGARAVDEIAKRLRLERVEAAEGICNIANTQMADGVRLVSVRRGVDPRRFAVIAFGGAAGLHVTEVARQLQIGRIVLPRLAAVLSAWGMMTTDLRCEIVRTHIAEAHRASAASLRRLFAQMEAEGRRRLKSSFRGEMHVDRALEMRYGEQIFEISVSLEGLDLHAPDLIPQVVERFHRRHEELFTYSLRDQEVVIVNAHASVVGELPTLPIEPVRRLSQRKRRPTRPRTRRQVYLGRWLQVPVFDLESLQPASTVRGPAIIETTTTTVLLRPADHAMVTPLGWLDIRVDSVRV